MGIMSVLAILGFVVDAMPTIEKLLSGLGAMIAWAYKEAFGDASTVDAIKAGIDEAEALVVKLDAELPMAVQWSKDFYTDLTGLLDKHPEVAQLLYSAHTVASGQGLKHGDGIRLTVAAHANVRSKQRMQ